MSLISKTEAFPANSTNRIKEEIHSLPNAQRVARSRKGCLYWHWPALYTWPCTMFANLRKDVLAAKPSGGIAGTSRAHIRRWDAAKKDWSMFDDGLLTYGKILGAEDDINNEGRFATIL